MIAKLEPYPSIVSKETLQATTPVVSDKVQIKCARLAFGYNAQRILYWFTIKRTNQYWEEVKNSGDGLRIIHYSSSPKPWDSMGKIGGDLEVLWMQKFFECTA